MSRHTRGLLAAALILAAATACSSSSGGDSKPSPSHTRAGLSAEWGPKLKQAAIAKTGICNQAGEKACAEHLTDIAIVVGDLESEIGDAGGAAAYPKTTARLSVVDKAVQAYTDHECLNDPNANIQGSPCPDDAQAIISGGDALQLTMEADEARG